MLLFLSKGFPSSEIFLGTKVSAEPKMLVGVTQSRNLSKLYSQKLPEYDDSLFLLKLIHLLVI